MNSWGENSFGRLLSLLATSSSWWLGEGESVEQKEKRMELGRMEKAGTAMTQNKPKAAQSPVAVTEIHRSKIKVVETKLHEDKEQWPLATALCSSQLISVDPTVTMGRTLLDLEQNLRTCLILGDKATPAQPAFIAFASFYCYTEKLPSWLFSFHLFTR